MNDEIPGRISRIRWATVALGAVLGSVLLVWGVLGATREEHLPPISIDGRQVAGAYSVTMYDGARIGAATFGAVVVLVAFAIWLWGVRAAKAGRSRTTQLM